MTERTVIPCTCLGVMQGRLLPMYKGRYQAHPVGYWQDEFPKAAALGLDCIEFIVDFEDADDNPLVYDGGTDEILAAIDQTGVAVYSVCVDYLMLAPLHHYDSAISTRSQQFLSRLLHKSREIGVTDLVIPCVDQSSLRDQATVDRLVDHLKPLLHEAEKVDVNLSLETDLPPQPFAELLQRLDSPKATVNYDTGNSACLGYDPREELSCYGDRITDIHIKDRRLGGSSVLLGDGNAQFDRFFASFRTLNYTGPIILQAFRDLEGEAVTQQQLKWLGQYLVRSK